MKAQIPPKAYSRVINMLLACACKSVTLYLEPKLIVRATWRHKPSAKHTREEIVVTIGHPNYLEALFIKKCLKAGEPFPVRKIQLKHWPVKRKPKKSVK